MNYLSLGVMSFLFSMVFAVPSFAADPYNCYQWNRANALKGNGGVDRSPWYEWWYYKVIEPKSGRPFYWVYGVVNPWDQVKSSKGTRATVAFGDFTQKMNVIQDYALQAFEARYDEPFVKVGDNVATAEQMSGAISDKAGNHASWNIRLTKRWGYNAMGWAMAIPKILNIYWYPAQASALMNGSLEINGEKIPLEDALAYQDRNWGNSFPKWWAWIVSNHFEGHPDTVLAAGGGKPKMLGHFDRYEGMSIGLLHEGREYFFRPNDGDIVETDISFGKWEVTATKLGKFKIIVHASAPREKFMLLPFSTPEGGTYQDYETLEGNLDVELYRASTSPRHRWILIEKLHSPLAGIEYGSY